MKKYKPFGFEAEKRIVSTHGITLISLVITIIILLILASVVISLGLGQNGIFRRAKQAKEQYALSEAREKLETVLMEAVVEKETNEKYDSENFLDYLLTNENMSVNGNTVTVNNYNFLIDREKLKIVESLGKTNVEVKYEVQKYLGKNEDNKYMVNSLITIQSNIEIESITIINPDGTSIILTTEKLQLAKDLNMEFDQEYKIEVKTKDNKTDTRTIIEKSKESISSVEELVEFRDKVNTGLTYIGKTIELTQDLDLSSVCGENINGEEISWEPITNYGANSKNVFNGTFNGNNHVIDNLYINGQKTYQGLFGRGTTNFIIENLIIGENSKVTGAGFTGLIIGYCERGTIRGCSNYGTVESKGSFAYGTGGIAGSSVQGVIESCFNAGDIKTEGRAVGGILGDNNTESTVKDCYNKGKVESLGRDEYDHSLTGGIVGSNIFNSTVENVYNIGDVTSQYTYVGGIVGYNGNSSAGTQIVKNVFNAGTIKQGDQTPSSDIGEGLGYLIGRYGSLTGKYKNTTKDDIKSWNEETIKTNLGDSFTKDINNINDGYPILKWQIPENR